MFNRNEFRAGVRRVLLTAHGVTVQTATKAQMANAVGQVYQMWAGFSDDKAGLESKVREACKDYLSRKS